MQLKNLFFLLLFLSACIAVERENDKTVGNDTEIPNPDSQDRDKGLRDLPAVPNSRPPSFGETPVGEFVNSLDEEQTCSDPSCLPTVCEEELVEKSFSGTFYLINGDTYSPESISLNRDEFQIEEIGFSGKKLKIFLEMNREECEFSGSVKIDREEFKNIELSMDSNGNLSGFGASITGNKLTFETTKIDNGIIGCAYDYNRRSLCFDLDKDQ
tara:strand:- start:5195 stop:5833 length:639 start_codon:yes stop_codon:yes gene_type:complete